ncbi:DUF5329 domain-containing protein [Microbulbifer sp. GL-2]|uniref:DUF5329 family protein n=1 Tax=Microbulbifer sp. GL-2 TaxID=2591606 RepID=UPI001164AD0D|nr:DUF5329 domain-containing protein [Microbulbifer sp. GL-2]BBM01958.1 hypothetical protein GL2_20320 [Microbulbifer sp. GL-2]
MTKYLAIILALYSTLLPPSLHANSPGKEIDHLINFVSSSECTFIRNDSEYSSSDAVKHMNKKYQYFSSKIYSAEEFIELSATKSTFSGKPYHIKCKNQPAQKSQSWLLNELARYREAVRLEAENTQPAEENKQKG